MKPWIPDLLVALIAGLFALHAYLLLKKKKSSLFIAEMCFLVSEVCPKILFDAYILLASFLFGRVRNTLFRKKSFCYDTMIISAVSFRVLGGCLEFISLFMCWKGGM